jgi:hypothetical protein
MRKTLSLAVTAVAAASLLATAPSADAAGLPGTSGKLTLWQNDGYQGQALSRYEYDSNLHNDACSGCDPGPGGNFGDDESSFVNKSKYWWVLYVDTQYGRYIGGGHSTELFCVRPNSHDADLGNNGLANLEDEISSMKRFTEQPGMAGCKHGHTIGRSN